ncbi:MAG: hypothetical protein ACO3VF_05470 [Tamlana sp.]
MMVPGTSQNLGYYLKKGPVKTHKLNVRSFKFYTDGALGSRGALLREPYTYKPVVKMLKRLKKPLKAIGN